MNRLIGFALCLSLSACASFSKDYPQKTFYAFEVARSTRVAAPHDAPVLQVQRFRSGELSKTQGLLYRTGPSTYEADYYAEFFAEPEGLVTTVVAGWLADTGLFSVNIAGTSEVDPEFVLQGALRSLYVDQTDPAETRAVVELQLFLTHHEGVRVESVWQRDYRREEVAAGSEGAEVLDAWNRGLASILEEAEAEMVQAFGPAN